MSNELLPILSNPAVLERTSAATRRVLEERARPASSNERFLSPDLYALLEQIVATILPQEGIDSQVDIAQSIDKRLQEGTNAGWRLADLPADGEAYTIGLTTLAVMLRQTPDKTFESMTLRAREDYLRSVAGGDVDASAHLPLSKWFGMLRTDAVKFYMSHPSTMQKIGYYGFADGETGTTDGPTQNEGWSAITADTALPFEPDIQMPAVITGREA